MNVSDYFIKNFQLDRIKEDQYRKCAYLNVRDNGDIQIELSNCNYDKQPYICKYSKLFNKII